MTHNLGLLKVSKIYIKKFLERNFIKFYKRNFKTTCKKKRDIKGYKRMSEDRLLSALKALESLKESEKNFDDTKPKANFYRPRIEKIRKKFNESRHKFSISKINEIRRNLYKIENETNFFAPKIRY